MGDKYVTHCKKEQARWVKVLATKPSHLSSIPRLHTVEDSDSHTLSSAPSLVSMAVRTHTQITVMQRRAETFNILLLHSI